MDKATGQPHLSGSDLKETLDHWSGPLIEPLLDINPSIPQVAPYPESSWPCACVTPVVKRRHGDAEELSKIGWREQVVVVHGLPLELVVLTLVNSSHEYSRVEAVDAAVAADPRFRYEDLDGQRVLIRSDAGPGNALNYRVRNQPDQPPELTFSLSTTSSRLKSSLLLQAHRHGQQGSRSPPYPVRRRLIHRRLLHFVFEGCSGR